MALIGYFSLMERKSNGRRRIVGRYNSIVNYTVAIAFSIVVTAMSLVESRDGWLQLWYHTGFADEFIEGVAFNQIAALSFLVTSSILTFFLYFVSAGFTQIRRQNIKERWEMEEQAQQKWGDAESPADEAY
ncbi:MAG: hypothetical protein LBL08_03170 [Candidatus Nomurabacteria bacterium]|nr:hypothetical protein [Candidatus Nomurabacteria bacterium]